MIAIDTNLLVYAHRSGQPEHESAWEALELAGADRRGWGTPVSCVAEFWKIVTHRGDADPPSDPKSAREFLQALADGGLRLWSPGPGFGHRLIRVAAELSIVGPRIFDLQIALTAFDNGATEIWTRDRGFATIPGLHLHDPLA